MFNNITPKIAVITGAGSGLGRAFAFLLAQDHAKLVLADIDANALAESKRILQEKFPPIAVETVVVDVSNYASVVALARHTISTFHRVDLLINCAGVAVAGAVWEYTEETWHWIFDINVMGVAFGIKAFVPQMILQGHGHVLNIASAAGLMNIGDMAAYNASKHAVVSITETLHHDLQAVAPDIGVSVACPSFFPTNIHQPKRAQTDHQTGDGTFNAREREGLEKMASAVMAGKLSADEVAARILVGLNRGDFYIFPHDDTSKGFLRRAERARDGLSPLNPRR